MSFTNKTTSTTNQPNHGGSTPGSPRADVPAINDGAGTSPARSYLDVAVSTGNQTGQPPARAPLPPSGSLAVPIQDTTATVTPAPVTSPSRRKAPFPAGLASFGARTKPSAAAKAKTSAPSFPRLDDESVDESKSQDKPRLQALSNPKQGHVTSSSDSSSDGMNDDDDDKKPAAQSKPTSRAKSNGDGAAAALLSETGDINQATGKARAKRGSNASSTANKKCKGVRKPRARSETGDINQATGKARANRGSNASSTANKKRKGGRKPRASKPRANKKRSYDEAVPTASNEAAQSNASKTNWKKQKMADGTVKWINADRSEAYNELYNKYKAKSQQLSNSRRQSEWFRYLCYKALELAGGDMAMHAQQLFMSVRPDMQFAPEAGVTNPGTNWDDMHLISPLFWDLGVDHYEFEFNAAAQQGPPPPPAAAGAAGVPPPPPPPPPNNADDSSSDEDDSDSED